MDVTTDKLVKDLKTVVNDAEELLKATASQGGEQIARIRARAEASLRTAQSRIREITELAELQAREGVAEADRSVRDNPWQSVGIAAAAGLFIGFLLGRK
jgi:ElaB/YqjD/DUF883 family membrane-anchored ribosome-binding protein